MTRQQEITYAQVQEKIAQARSRANKFMNKALDATNAEDYEKFVGEMNKAAKDAETWYLVLDSLRT